MDTVDILERIDPADPKSEAKFDYNTGKFSYKPIAAKAEIIFDQINDVYFNNNSDTDKQYLYNIILEKHETMQINNVVVETLDPNTLVAKLFDGSLGNKQRNKLIKSLNAYHKNLKNKPNKTLRDYLV